MPIDQVQVTLNPAVPIVVSIVTAFLIFGVALDLEAEHFRRVLRKPRAPLVGLLAQYGLVPAVAFLVALLVVDEPSIALGLMFIAACPGGSGSNYLTGLARGDVALSVSISAITSVTCVVATPLVFAFWASRTAETDALLRTIELDVAGVVLSVLLMLALPTAAGMLIRARRPRLADRLRGPLRRISVILFLLIVAGVIASNLKLLVAHPQALVPVVLTGAIGGVVGWGTARLFRLDAGERRAVVMEVAVQNVSLAIATVLVFYPRLAGMLITCLMWTFNGVVAGFALAWIWSRMPPRGERT